MIPALNQEFRDTRGRAPNIDGKPFIWLGRLEPVLAPHLHLIEVWLGDRHELHDACDDEIFHDVRRAA